MFKLEGRDVQGGMTSATPDIAISAPALSAIMMIDGFLISPSDPVIFRIVSGIFTSYVLAILLSGCFTSPGMCSDTVRDLKSEKQADGAICVTKMAKAGVKNQARQFRFLSGVRYLPHPSKEARGGEDACFIQEYALGVFDGLGSWMRKGIDPAECSRSISKFVSLFAKEENDASELALQYAVNKNDKMGTTTSCVAAIDGESIYGHNVGDSGLLVFRNGAIAYRAPKSSKGFNSPYDIGRTENGEIVNNIGEGDVIIFPIELYDVIIMASDGLWDNLFEHEIAQCVLAEEVLRGPDREDRATKLPTSLENMNECDRRSVQICSNVCGGEVSQCIAEALASQARNAATSKFRRSPFEEEAEKAGLRITGGKMDDITVICAIVVDDECLHS